MLIKNLTKSYASRVVYKNFNLEIEDGKITVILGESGSGKTTLLNCIAGLTNYEGEITLSKCSYVFQTPRLIPCMTVLENLLLIKNDRQEALEILKSVGLYERRDEYPVALSGGEAQRVALARAMHFNGDVWLLDEPFSSLDLKRKNEIMRLFSEMIKKRRATAVFVTHDVDEAIAMGDRILVIANGGVVCDFKVDERDENLRKTLVNALIS